MSWFTEKFWSAEGHEKRKADEISNESSSYEYEDKMNEFLNDYEMIFEHANETLEKWSAIQKFVSKWLGDRNKWPAEFINKIAFQEKPMRHETDRAKIIAMLERRFGEPSYINKHDFPLYSGGRRQRERVDKGDCCVFVTDELHFAKQFVIEYETNDEGQNVPTSSDLNIFTLKDEDDKIGPFYGPMSWLQAEQLEGENTYEKVSRAFDKKKKVDVLREKFIRYYNPENPVTLNRLFGVPRGVVSEENDNNDGNEDNANSIFASIGVSRYNDSSSGLEFAESDRFTESEWLLIPMWYKRLNVETKDVDEVESEEE